MPAFFKGMEADILEAVPDAIVVVDGDGRIVFVNSTAQELFGYGKEACLGQPVEVLLPHRHQDAHEAWRQSYLAAPARRPMANGKDMDGRHRDGHAIPVNVSLAPMQADGRTFVIAAIRDISIRRRVEEALRQSEARLRAAVEHLPFAFWAFDADGRCFLQNGACKEWWGDHRGKRVDQIRPPDELVAQIPETLRRVLSGEVVRHDHSVGTDPDQRVIHTIAAPIVNGDEVTGVLAVHLDVTEQRRAQALEVELRAAHESERLKDALLSTMSHELRTPISVIRGYATLAADYADRLERSEVTAYLRDIDRYALQLERLVADLLTMSRIEAGALVVDLKPVEVESTVSEAVEAFTVAGSARDFKVSIAPGTKMLADAGRIRQVLLNLFDNADKYSEPGAPIEVIAERDSSDRVRIRVRDHGQGVAEEELGLIFGRFYRVPDGSRVRGAGLGLAICRSIIERHGGSIHAALPPDGGLEVTLLLPSA